MKDYLNTIHFDTSIYLIAYLILVVSLTFLMYYSLSLIIFNFVNIQEIRTPEESTQPKTTKLQILQAWFDLACWKMQSNLPRP